MIPDKSDFKRHLCIGLGLVAVSFLVGCAASSPRPIRKGNSLVGHASWYGQQFHGRKTASGEVYDMYALTAAHRSAPFGTKVRVRNLSNQQEVTVRINDRGPFVRGRIIDLSYAAAQEIGLVAEGVAQVELKFLSVGRSPAYSSRGGFFVQAGSYRDLANAQRMANTLKRSFPQTQVGVDSSGKYHRVRLGPLPSERRASQVVSRLEDLGYDTLVLRP